jgi:pilus assembly protein CpaE
MTSNAQLLPEPTPIVACTISRNVANFDLLIEDMEAEMGESWGDLSFADAGVFFQQPDSDLLEFVVIAIDPVDEKGLSLIADLVKTAKGKGIKSILVTRDISPGALHQLLRLGASEFIPYPLPRGELGEAIQRLRQPPAPAPAAPATPAPEAEGDTGSPDRPHDELKTTLDATDSYNGLILPVHGVSGGIGATTFAVNLAWELANISKEDAPRVCLIDLDLQFGSVSTYLDLPRREAVFELLSDIEAMDSDSFMQALLTYKDKLQVLTAPFEMLPLDILDTDDIKHILDVARANFDFVVIDMPTTLVSWFETVLDESFLYFAMIELDMRSAQNAMRLMQTLEVEDLPVEKLRFALNRAPKFTDISGKARVKRMAESLGIKMELLLPDGGKQVPQACDDGVPLITGAPKNPLRKEIHKLATSVAELNQTAKTGK